MSRQSVGPIRGYTVSVILHLLVRVALTVLSCYSKLGLNGRRKDESLQAATSDRQLLDQK
jgi:hypothetical protein